jgi:hypothetical protein
MTVELWLRLCVLQPVYLLLDWEKARWLPWWRRYAPSVFLALGTVAEWRGYKRIQAIAFVGWCIAYAANWWTARRNKRNGNDISAKEVAETQLTDVDQRSFNQQTAEALS